MFSTLSLTLTPVVTSAKILTICVHLRPGVKESMKNIAVFLDRDGVLNRLIYHREAGIVDSPFSARQFKLLPGAAEAVRELNRLGLAVAVISNQPGIAKGHFTRRDLDEMTAKMERGLAARGARLDGVYYCLHHPEARKARYRARCGCRKPRPGLLREAAGKLGVGLRRSFMVGDSIVDVQAGKAAGCTTVYLGNWKCDICRHMRAKKVKPDYIVPDLPAAVRLIRRLMRL